MAFDDGNDDDAGGEGEEKLTDGTKWHFSLFKLLTIFFTGHNARVDSMSSFSHLSFLPSLALPSILEEE